MTNRLFGCTISITLALLGGCGSAERRADQGCPDEEVLAASGACCDPALAVVVEGISDCRGSPVHPDGGTPDAHDGGDAGGFVFPCAPDEFLRANGDCVQFAVSDGGTPDAGDADGGSCTVITVHCPDTQAYDPQTGLCTGPGEPDGGTQCPAVKCPVGQTYDPAAQRCRDLVEACRFTCNDGQLLTDACDCVDPAPACKTCVGALLNTTTNECVVAPVCPGPCPSGTARNNEGTCVTVGSTWTFPCNAGQGEVLKADGTCYAPPVLPGPCADGQARNNAGTCVPVSVPWTFPCNPGESLSADGTTCLPPPTQCPPGTLLNTATGHCDTPPPAWNQTCASTQYLTPNGQQCVTPPAPWTFPCNAGLGEVLKADNTCYVPPVPPGPCPSGKARDNAGTCVSIGSTWTFPCTAPKQLAADGSCKDPAPGPSMDIAYIAPPPLPGTTTAIASQASVNFGSLEIRNVANLNQGEIPDLALTVLVADDPAGSYTSGSSGSVRADQRIEGCRLRDWPPLSGTFGPVRPDTSGRVVFSGSAIRVLTARRLSVECDLADQLPVGSSDGFAVDLASGMQATAVDGTARPSIPLTVSGQNGTPPLARVSVGCGHRVLSDAGVAYALKAKASFALASDSPSGRVTRGFIPIARYAVSASPCESVSLTRVKIRISYTDNSNTGWADTVYQEYTGKTRVALGTSENVAWGTTTAGDKTTTSFTLSVNATAAPLTIPAGQTRTVTVLMDATNASANLHDQVQTFPADTVSWYGMDAPSAYPPVARATDFAAASSSPVSF